MITEPIVSTEFIKSYFPDRSNPQIVALQTRVTRLIAEYLRSSFTIASYTETASTARKVVTAHLPIQSIVSILDLLTGEALVEGTDFIVYPEYIQFPSRVEGTKDLSISYTAGMDTLPAMVEVVAEDLIRFWAFKDGKTDELFFRSEEMEDRSYANKEVSEASILSKLAGHRYTPLGSYNRNRIVRIGVI